MSMDQNRIKLFFVLFVIFIFGCGSAGGGGGGGKAKKQVTLVSQSASQVEVSAPSETTGVGTGTLTLTIEVTREQGITVDAKKAGQVTAIIHLKSTSSKILSQQSESTKTVIVNVTHAYIPGGTPEEPSQGDVTLTFQNPDINGTYIENPGIYQADVTVPWIDDKGRTGKIEFSTYVQYEKPEAGENVPKLSSISPENAVEGSQTMLTINGENFSSNPSLNTINFIKPPSADIVKKVTPFYATSTILQFFLPSDIEKGTYLISVTSNSVNSENSLTFDVVEKSEELVPPTLSNMENMNEKSTYYHTQTGVSGDLVRIYGKDFGSEDDTRVVSFGGIPAKIVSYDLGSDPQTLDVVVPKGAQSGDVKLLVMKKTGQSLESNALGFTVPTGTLVVHLKYKDEFVSSGYPDPCNVLTNAFHFEGAKATIFVSGTQISKEISIPDTPSESCTSQNKSYDIYKANVITSSDPIEVPAGYQDLSIVASFAYAQTSIEVYVPPYGATTTNLIILNPVEALILKGDVEGYVKDADTLSPISGATVWVKNTDGSISQDITDESGHYYLSGVTTGTAVVTAEKDGYLSNTVILENVYSGRVNEAPDIYLSPKGGS